MTPEEFKKYTRLFADWVSQYQEDKANYPVIPDIQPGEIKAKIPIKPPLESCSIENILEDFDRDILPGITHWQHPGFFAYFPASTSEPSVLAEMLTAALGAQCMVWFTSPAAEELEERMMEWLRSMIGLPSGFTGVIQDTASTSTLVALLTARERKSDWQINETGFAPIHKYRVYASVNTHSSIDKAVRISGIGFANLIKIEVDENEAMKPESLRKAIIQDLHEGYIPLAVVGTFGTTSTTAIDPLAEIGRIAADYGLWFHVDAAYAGSALILPEIRTLAEGIELADSIVFNPHKWLFTNFDCSAYFIRDPKALVQTFSIMPEYLKTPADQMVNNYRDWGIQLGRRFRALKLWFVLRFYGVSGLQNLISNHIQYAKWFESQIIQHPGFELLAPTTFSLVCFRFKPASVRDEQELNKLNEELLNRINKCGALFLTHTTIKGKYSLRMVAGRHDTKLIHWENAWKTICRISEEKK
jgi:aromatic-L-amino-acid decarboxylase